MRTPPVGEVIDDFCRAFGVTPPSPAYSPDVPSWPKEDPWWPVYDLGESPIERQMCVALREGLEALPGDGEYTFEKLAEIAKQQPSQAAVVVYAQQKILHFRVDFLAVYYDAKRDQFRRAIIECDGHDYHLGNYQARIRDMKRDALLQRHRYPIFRFTGSQIFRAASKLVPTVANHLLFGA